VDNIVAKGVAWFALALCLLLGLGALGFAIRWHVAD
jgi:hypothetical protein